nr:protein ANTAGONIST OF LIKE HETEROCHROMATIN PROTEIN 1-like [Pelodiscus sinensis]|eukprot:XP_025041720.1 protein ANTAGONIST OF LIKE HETEROCHROMATIN PROTEIN 1-like [Pelodiscus sinensis]
MACGEGHQHHPSALAHLPGRHGPHRHQLCHHGLPQLCIHISIRAPDHWASDYINCKVVRSINVELLKRLVRLGDLDTIFAGLGFQNCGGALDGTHIPICTPPHRAAQIINHKGYFSMVLQALVNHRGQFIDICVGWSGWTHDSCIFLNLYLYHRLQAGIFFPQLDLTLQDMLMPVCIVTYVAYPLILWLMKSYAGHLDASTELFNTHLSQARMQMECAFGHLKWRFRCLLTRLDMSERKPSPRW